MRTNAAARAVTALVLGGLVLTGCGKSHPASAPATTTPQTPTASVPVVTTAPATPTPTRTKKPKPTKKPTAGDGDSEGDGRPATEGGGICSVLDATEVGPVLGQTVTGSALPGGGCEFVPLKDRAPSAGIVETSFAATTGGMAGAKTNATSSVEGNPVDVAGIGEAAFVVTGTAFGGPDYQGAGAVKVADRLVSVSVTQSEGLSRAKVKNLVLGLLRLAAAKLAG